MTTVHCLFSRTHRSVDPLFAAAARGLFLSALVCLPQLALAYPGEQMVSWARGTIVAPLCFFAIVVSIVVALVRPQLAVVAVWVTIISLFLMFVLSNGATIPLSTPATLHCSISH
jgi:hypothetical protein